MRLMKYTCRIGNQKIDRTGYFADMSVLRDMLQCWSFNGYEYYQTGDQWVDNEKSPILPKDYKFPIFSILWNHRHSYTFVC